MTDAPHSAVGPSTPPAAAVRACLRPLGSRLLVASFGCLTLLTSREPFEPVLSYDGQSYLDIAHRLLAGQGYPLLAARPPLYPTVLAAILAAGGEPALWVAVALQRFLWLATGVLVLEAVSRLGRSRGAGISAGMLFYTLAEIFSATQLLYAETFAIFFAAASVLALVAALGRRRELAGCSLAAVLALAAAYSRPLFQLLLPLLALAAALAAGARLPRRLLRMLPFLVVGGLGLLPWYVANRRAYGLTVFAQGAETSLANYLGDRRLLGRFPPAYAAVEQIYRDAFAANPSKELLAWWDVQGAWAAAYERYRGVAMADHEVHRDMGEVAAAVLRSAPDYYLTRWAEVWREFSTSSWHPVRGPWSPLSLCNPGWALFWQHASLWLVPALFFCEFALVALRGSDPLRLLPITAYLALSIANTAIEPWPGQIRYRLELEPFLVMALGLLPSAAALAWPRRRPR